MALEEYFAWTGDFACRVSECEELVGVTYSSECHFLKLNGTIEAHF